MQTIQETVLVTGASSGIGAELARRFAASGARLVLVSRRAERLREVADELGPGTEVVPLDLAQPGAPGRLVSTLAQRGLVIDVLVNSAGFGLRGAFAELDRERQLAMVRVNVEALTELTHLVLPGMLERRRGGVLSVASTAAWSPGPNMAVYFATKAYVLSFSEALYEELRSSGVTVTCLCPGPTRTEFADVAGLEGSRAYAARAVPASTVARAGYEGFRAGKAVVVPGLARKLSVLILRYAPRSLVRRLVARLQ